MGKMKEASQEFDDAARRASNVRDVIPQTNQVDNVVKFADIAGVKMIVTGYKVMRGQDGPYAFLTFLCETIPGESGMSCGSEVIMDKLNAMQEKGAFPCKVRMVKVKDRYYDFFGWDDPDPA